MDKRMVGDESHLINAGSGQYPTFNLRSSFPETTNFCVYRINQPVEGHISIDEKLWSLNVN